MPLFRGKAKPRTWVYWAGLAVLVFALVLEVLDLAHGKLPVVGVIFMVVGIRGMYLGLHPKPPKR